MEIGAGDNQEPALPLPVLGEDSAAHQLSKSSEEESPSHGGQVADGGMTPTASNGQSFMIPDAIATVPGQADMGTGKTSRPQSADKRYQDEVLMPLLVRRRAEARFKEASYVHENSINQMKAELQEIERRTVKQQNWMKQVDAQVLKVELTKATYQVRLESARKRVMTLGENLSTAYENMTILLEERLEVEDIAAKNDALVWYMHLLGVSDADNAANFMDNKTDLLFLTAQSGRLRSKRP